MSKQKLLASVSGGRTSWMMAKWIKDNLSNKYEVIYVYANTGKEREETLEFNKRCQEHFDINLIWVEAVTNELFGQGVTAKVVDFNSASRNGEPFEGMIAKHGIPNTAFPHCSRELKAYCIRAYARQLGWKNYLTAIGIRADEPARLDWKKAKKERLIYPFANLRPTNKSDIASFWSKQPFDLELKSYEGNCDLCWKKSNRKLMTIVSEHPELAEWWKEMEAKYDHYLPESRQHNEKIVPPFRFYRGNDSIADIVEEARLPFDPAVDESKDINDWSFWNEEMDANSGCVETCEAF